MRKRISGIGSTIGTAHAAALALLVLVLVPVTPAAARTYRPPASFARAAGDLALVDRRQMPPVDNTVLLAAADRLEAASLGAPLYVAYPFEVDLDLGSSGTWELLDDGSRLWRLRIHSPTALHLNLGFTRFDLPAGAGVWIYDPAGDYVEGPYTARDPTPQGELWTPVIVGDEVVIELYVPAAAAAPLALRVGFVNHGFRTFSRKQGSCNNDVICPEGDPWRDQIRSVGFYTIYGTGVCSGEVVNNTAQDLTPYFLSAHHCGVTAANAGSMVVYWNFESPTCGQLSGGSFQDNQSGAAFRASDAASDFLLVELAEPPDPAFNVYYSGWNVTGNVPQSAVGIHHPGLDEKAISFDDDPLTKVNIGYGGVTHWQVGNWEDGTTEPGSSGSGLWDPADGLVVGILTGGWASCTVIDADFYGMLSVAWNGDGTPQGRLRDWLDPLDTGTLVLDGRNMSGFDLAAHPEVLDICTGDEGIYTVDVLQSYGFTDPVTLSVSGEPAGASTLFGTNPITPPGSSTLTIGSTGGAAAGSYTLEISGASSALSRMIEAGLNVFDSLPGAVTLLAPADGAANQPTTPTFSWQPAAGAGSYTIEIATDATFEHVVESAGGVRDPSFTPATDLSTRTRYAWRVRAENGCGAGGNSPTFTFVTEPAPGECPLGATANQLLADDLESGAAGWTHGGNGDTWTLSGTRTHSGAVAFHAADVAAVSDQYLVSPPLTLPTGEAPLSLELWHYQAIEDRSEGGCFDGAVVEITSDGGATWTRLETELVTDPYDGPISTCCSNPLAGENAWCGDPRDWHASIVDLDAFAGHLVQLRFRLTTDSSAGREGWYVDDLVVQSCSETLEVFSDGFESGDMSSWSAVVP